MSNTEQHVVIAPIDYWQSTLQEKVEAAALKKAPASKYTSEEIEITISVNDRSEDDIILSFADSVDWQQVAGVCLAGATSIALGSG